MTLLVTNSVQLLGNAVEALEISGNIVLHEGTGLAGTLVRLLDAGTGYVMSTAITNSIGDFAFNYGPPIAAGKAIVIADRNDESQAAMTAKITQPAMAIILSFVPPVGIGGLEPMLGGRKLYISEGKIKALPEAVP